MVGKTSRVSGTSGYVKQSLVSHVLTTKALHASRGVCERDGVGNGHVAAIIHPDQLRRSRKGAPALDKNHGKVTRFGVPMRLVETEWAKRNPLPWIQD